MQINKMPLEIQELVKLRFIEEEGSLKNYKEDDVLMNTLTINMTKEFKEDGNGGFWSEINRGNYAVFYERYPKLKSKINPGSIKTENQRIYFGTHKGRKIKITIEYE